MPAAETAATKLLALLDAVGEGDLAELDTAITTKRAELGGLLSARKLLAARLGKAAPRKSPVRKAKADAPAAHARRVSIARLLAARGPLALSVLANELDIPAGSMGYTLDCDWFEKQPGGAVRLTTVGRKEAGL